MTGGVGPPLGRAQDDRQDEERRDAGAQQPLGGGQTDGDTGDGEGERGDGGGGQGAEGGRQGQGAQVRGRGEPEPRGFQTAVAVRADERVHERGDPSTSDSAGGMAVRTRRTVVSRTSRAPSRTR